MLDFFDPLARSDSESSSDEAEFTLSTPNPQTLQDPTVITLTSSADELRPFLEEEPQPSLSTTTLEYSIHTPGRHLARELAFVFPALPLPSTQKKKKGGKGPKANAPVGELLVLHVFQKCKHEPLPVTKESSHERKLLIAQFKSWSTKICESLDAQGHWAEFVDPDTHLPVRTANATAAYDNVDAVVRILRYPSLQNGSSRVLVHPSWGTRNLPGSIITNAPVYFFKEVVTECSREPDQFFSMEELPVVDKAGLEGGAEGGEGVEEVVREVVDPLEDVREVDDEEEGSDDVPVAEKQPVAAPVADAAVHAPSKLLVFLPNSDSEEELYFDQSYERRPRQFTPDLRLELLPRHEHFDEDMERVIAVFVARFDTLRGQVIEYKYPEDADVSGLEYTTLPSGAHNLKTDVIYFEHEQKYGVAALASHMISNDDADARERERGARVRSVGIISTGYAGLHRHLPFLKEQAARFVLNSGVPEELQTYFRNETKSPVPHVGLVESIGLRDLQHEHPISYLPDFVEYFGPTIFVLWKYALLSRRIIFYTLPPIELACYHVLFTRLLAAHSAPSVPDVPSAPLFCINVADISKMSTMETFTACTTESIFQSKENLYDLYVHHQQLIFGNRTTSSDQSTDSTQTPRFTLNEMDQARYLTLAAMVKNAMSTDLPLEGEVESGLGRRNSERPRSGGENGRRGSDEEGGERLLGGSWATLDVSAREGAFTDEIGCALQVIEFFQRLNTHLFRTLSQIADSEDPVIRPCRMRNLLGLHPRHDIAFVRELCHVHGFAIDVVGDGKGGPLRSGTKRRSSGAWKGILGKKCRCCPDRPVEEVVSSLGLDAGKGKKGRWRRGSK
ncbi:hypothetical protein HK097_009828 [Rhizophlyctis rosea]|uniref:UDENN domain-containing protein n=1 Tax=Rhizophlyctis rosea TaxID=64517 RepID=A0AAD5S9Y0_9FUNG|nr:hypothetical protein HK097_009828 [Rhizophlyctis rosea]